MPTQNRFIKIDGSFERPGLSEADVIANLQNFAAANPEAARTLTIPPLKGSTSNTAGSSLPAAAPTPTTAPAPVSTPFDDFNVLLGGILKNAQGVSTVDYLKRKRGLERAALGRVEEITPEEQRTFSPSQQEAIRSGRTEALRPEIDANAYELKKAEDSIDNFFRVHTEAQKLGKEFAENMVAPDSVIENAKRVIEADPDKLSTVLAGFNDKSKQKILGTIDYSKMKKPVSGDVSGTMIEVGGKKLLINPKTGETIKDFGSVGTGTISPYQAERGRRIVQSVDELNTLAKENKGIFGRTAAIPLPLAARSDAFRTYDAQLTTLKSSIFSNELTAMREASKTGGAVGNVSDREGDKLENALGALQMYQSPEDHIAQLKKVKESIDTWYKAMGEIIPGTVDADGGITVTDPSGGVHKFPDQASADAFKKAAGIQ